MSITEQDIYKLSELSKLYIDESNIEMIISNINKTLSLIEKISDLNTSDIEPMFHSDEQAIQRLRLDEVTESNDRELIQSIASPSRIENGLYLVPKVIEVE